MSRINNPLLCWQSGKHFALIYPLSPPPLTSLQYRERLNRTTRILNSSLIQKKTSFRVVELERSKSLLFHSTRFSARHKSLFYFQFSSCRSVDGFGGLFLKRIRRIQYFSIAFLASDSILHHNLFAFCLHLRRRSHSVSLS